MRACCYRWYLDHRPRRQWVCGHWGRHHCTCSSHMPLVCQSMSCDGRINQLRQYSTDRAVILDRLDCPFSLPAVCHFSNYAISCLHVFFSIGVCECVQYFVSFSPVSEHTMHTKFLFTDNMEIKLVTGDVHVITLKCFGRIMMCAFCLHGTGTEYVSLAWSLF